jgi:glyoxylase-like metal-dependent hydrolase (beta-lactamase superfamily II)
MTVGNARITSLTDTREPGPPGEVYIEIREEVIKQYSQFLLPNGDFMTDFSCYLVQADGRTVLIDTAWGPPHEGKLLEEIAAAGVKPEDIDVVTYSHLHGDHYGWSLIKDGPDAYRPRFPNARYLVSQLDWEYFSTAAKREESGGYFDEWFAPIERLGVMDFIGGGHVFSQSLVSEHTPGHTPGHLSFVVSSGGQKCFILGDVAFNPIDTANPNWKTSWDEDQDLAVRTRYATLERLSAEGTLVAANHFPQPTFGRFVKDGGRYGWKAEG